MRVCTLTAAILLVSSTVFAQQHGAVKGYVKDAQDAILPGVTIVLSSPELMGAQTAVTDGEGYYRFLALPPGNYRLEATLPGFATYVRVSLRVQVGATLTESFTMAIASMKEQVTVTATMPVIDLETAVRAFNINQSAISNIPIAPRLSYTDVWLVTPGVTKPYVTPTTSGTVASDVQVNSAMIKNDSRSSHIQNDSYENKAFFDGMDMSDPMSGRMVAQIPYEAIEEINIKAAGAEAEFGNARSAQMQIVTKSGGNTFKGSALIQYQPESFNWANVQGASSQKASYVNPALSVGGPIMRDRVWFFGSWKYDQADLMYANTVAVKELVRQERGNPLYTKVTSQVTPRNNISVTFGWDRIKYANSDPDGVARFSMPAALSTDTVGGQLFSARWNAALRNNLLVEVVGGFHRTPQNKLGQGSGPQQRYFDVFNGNLVLADGNMSNNYFSQRDSTYVHAALTFVPSRMVAGRHELKAGFEARPHQHIVRATFYPADSHGFYQYRFGMDFAKYGLTKPYLFEVEQCVPTCGPSNTVDVQNFNWYVQDRWHPTRQLTINAGVRWERSIENMQDRNNLPSALLKFDPNILNNIEFSDSRLVPRIGVSYSLGSQGVVRANFGQYIEFVGTGDDNNYPNANAFNSLRIRPEDYGKGIDALYLFTAGTVPVNANFNRNMRAEYNDEFLGSYERQLPGNIAFDTTFVYRKINNSQANDANVVFGPNGTFTRIDPNFDRVNMRFFPATDANRYNSYNFKSLQFGVRHNFTRRVGVIASISRFWRQYENLRFNPTETEQFVYATPSALNQSGYDYTWNYRISSFYNFPKDIAVAAYFDASSPQWYNDLTGNYTWNGSAPRVTLPNGRAVADFVWQAQNSYYVGKQWGLSGRTTSTEYNLNVRFQKGFTIGKYQSDASIDFFNVLNSLMYHDFQTYDVRNPQYGTRINPQTPRVAQLNVRFRF